MSVRYPERMLSPQILETLPYGLNLFYYGYLADLLLITMVE